MCRSLDIDEQSAVYTELRRFNRSDVSYWHRTRLIRLSEGVSFLTERVGVSWFVDFVAIGQIVALRDPWLRQFQLWEFWMRGERAVVTCSRDSEDEVFRTSLRNVSSALSYARLYVQGSLLMLPSEH
jgi:hypothetical protein